jgi:hypothetical protein
VKQVARDHDLRDRDLRNGDLDDQVARFTASEPDVTEVPDPYLVTISTAGRDGHGVRANGEFSTFHTCVASRLATEDPTGAPAGETRLDRHTGFRGCTQFGVDLAQPNARGAFRRARNRLVTGRATDVARHENLKANRALRPGYRIGCGDLDRHVNVRTVESLVHGSEVVVFACLRRLADGVASSDDAENAKDQWSHWGTGEPPQGWAHISIESLRTSRIEETSGHFLPQPSCDLMTNC